MPTTFDSAVNNPSYQSAKRQMIDALRKELSVLSAPRPSSKELEKDYAELVDKIAKLRGRELFFKYVGTGAGNGPFIELADGSVKYDLITGIGVNFFGHGNLELFEAELDGLWGDVMQGNLGPNVDYPLLMEKLLEAAGPKSRLKHVWLSTCGATANETALKIIRQKKAPATKVFAFKDCFAGRTTALQEITDNPKYREGQPTYGEVHYLPFHDPRSKLSASEQGVAAAALMRAEMARQPGRFAMFELEIVQGEGGFHVAPREFLLPMLEEAKKAGLGIWVDEVQTFGRTGEAFCFQRLGIDEYVDVVTVAKLLQTGAVLYTSEFNPKAGLISGTFAGATSGIRAGIKALEILKTRMCGPQGRIQQLEKLTLAEFARIQNGPCGKHVIDYTAFGGMVACTVFDGSLEVTKKVLFKLWDLGAIAFYCGHGPYRLRMLPPFGVITDAQWRHVFQLLEQAIAQTAEAL